MSKENKGDAPTITPAATVAADNELHPVGMDQSDKDAVRHLELGPASSNDDHNGGGGVKTDLDGELRITHDMTPEEKATILRLANEQDTGPNIMSYRYLMFVLTCLCVILNSGDNGESDLSRLKQALRCDC